MEKLQGYEFSEGCSKESLGIRGANIKWCFLENRWRGEGPFSQQKHLLTSQSLTIPSRVLLYVLKNINEFANESRLTL